MHKLTRRTFLKISAGSIAIAALPLPLSIALGKDADLRKESELQLLRDANIIWSPYVRPGRYSISCMTKDLSKIYTEYQSGNHLSHVFDVEESQNINVSMEMIRGTDRNIIFSNLQLERLDFRTRTWPNKYIVDGTNYEYTVPEAGDYAPKTGIVIARYKHRRRTKW